MRETPLQLCVGPLLLGDIYNEMPDQTLAELPYKHLKDALARTARLAHKDVVAALRTCRVYILSGIQFTERKGRQVREFGPDNSKVVLEGDFVFELRSQDGKPVTLCIRAVALTKTKENVSDDPYCTSGLRVDLRMTWSNGNGLLSQDFTFYSRAVHWDIKGKVQWTVP